MNPHRTYEEILCLVDEFDPIAYAKTRNHLSGAVSRLSAYITRGVISLPAIRARIFTRYSAHEAQKFIQELAWREYFQKVYTAKGNEIFSNLRFTRDDWRHHEVVSAISHAGTGITVIDESLQELMAQGYMHNHARMWTAMVSCNVAKAHWYTMVDFCTTTFLMEIWLQTHCHGSGSREPRSKNNIWSINEDVRTVFEERNDVTVYIFRYFISSFSFLIVFTLRTVIFL